MQDVPEINLEDAREKLDAGDAIFVDIRDSDSYQTSHIPGAVNLNNENVQDFMAKTDKNDPIIVYCYHGKTSLGGAAFFLQNGFSTVHSMSEGFEGWRLAYDFESEAEF